MTSRWRALKLVLPLLATVVLAACESSEPGAPLPAFNETLQLEMAEGGRLVYDAKLSVGEILRVRVDHEDLDIVLSIEPPTGPRREFDSGNEFNGPEWLIFQAQKAGKHRVAVDAAAAKHRGRSGTVSLTVQSQGNGNSDDLLLLRAHDALASISARTATAEQITELEELIDSPAATLPDLIRARLNYLLGRIHRFAGRPADAAAFLRVAVQGFQDFGKPWEETPALNRLGFVLFQIGELDEAERVLSRADELSPQVDQPRTRAATWSNLGILNAARGHHSDALHYYRRSEELYEAVDDGVGIAYCRSNIGTQLLFLGEIEAGIGSLKEAADLWRALNRPSELGTTFVSSAWGFSLRSEITDHAADLETALELTDKAVALFEEGDSRWDLGVALEQRGWYRLQLGHPSLALQDLDHAASLADDAVDRMRSNWIGLGRGAALARLGKLDEARVPLEKSLQGFVEQGHHTGQVETYLELARLERSAGGRKGAADLLDRAIQVVERPRAQLLTDEFRRSYLAIHQDVYQELVDLWAEASWREAISEPAEPDRAREFGEKALEACERGRARGLLDRFTRSDRRWAGAESGEKLRRALDSLEARVLLPPNPSEEASSVREGASPTAAGIDAVAGARLEWWQALETDRSNPVGAASVPKPPRADSVYSQLDEGTTIVVYSLGQKRSWALLVSAGSVQVVPLAPRGEIELAARRVQELLPRWDSPGSKMAARESLPALAELVWRPVEDLLTTDHVGIVASGALLGVPFSALPDAGETPLAATRSFVYLPSLSILEYLRRRGADRSQETTQPLFTIIADPVFGLSDPRLAAGRISNGPVDSNRALPRLPGTALEAQHLEELLAQVPGAPRTRVLAGFEAKADLFRNGTLKDSRFLHIATHGIVDDRDPALAGLVFSLYDSYGQKRDGFLPVRDLYRTDLAADLVVLSACRTGKGQPMRGEGLVGFSHAFFAAGARHLLVSLWDVDDEATAELMRRYYSHLFVDRLDPVRALGMAQEEMRRHPRWSSPRHWAGFVAWGDWELN